MDCRDDALSRLVPRGTSGLPYCSRYKLSCNRQAVKKHTRAGVVGRKALGAPVNNPRRS